MTLPPSLQAATNEQRAHFNFNSTGLCGLVASIVIGMLFACWLLPDGFITGTHPYWLAQNEDITVYISGFNAFFRESWLWPLWRIESLNWPEGTLTTFVDAIPFYSAVLKLAAPGAWFPFNPYGYWVAICLLLQAVGVWWVLREARAQSWSALICLTLLLLSFPAWLARMGHISLLSQWIIVFAVALMFRSARRNKLAGFGWILLLWVGFFTNVYLFAMAALVFTADLLNNIVRGRWKSAVAWSVTVGISLVISAQCTMWPIPGSTGSPDVGFGIYSMNLLSPLTGSRFFDLPRHSGEQFFEGFNYIGIGGLLVLAGALYAALTRPGDDAKAQPRAPISFWILMLLVTLYALSNQVYLGEALVWQWQLPEWAVPITGQLRASGRFFWLVGYALVIFSVITITRRLPRLGAVLILIGATMVQAVDLWPQLRHVRDLQPKAGAQIIHFDAWDKALAEHTQTIYFFPKFKCGRQSDLFVTLLPVMRYASERGLNINTGYIARHNPVCEGEAEEIASSDTATSAYIFATQEYGQERIAGLLPKDLPMQCTTLDFATICHRAKSTERP